MPPVVDSILILIFLIVLARFLKRSLGILQRLFIPSSLIAGLLGLVAGPQVLGIIPSEVTGYWEPLPKYLIIVVFAGLFLGRVIPRRKEIWQLAGPQIAFGNTLAWGQYVIGIALAMFILTPVFGANPMAGALIEIGFEGGHGTSAGLAPTFQQLGWPEGTDIALALATVSIFVAIIAGILFVNWYHRKIGKLYDEEEWKQHRRQMIRSGYNLVSVGRKISTNPKAVVINILAFTIAIGFGWIIMQAGIWIENIILEPFTSLRFLTYVPMFPMAMIGGLILQMFLRKIHKEKLIQRRTAAIISTLALDLLLASAISTVSLSAIRDNFATFAILAVAGIGWIILAFIVLAPRMFPTFWFEKGLTNMGQSMGMTATGLLLMRLVDPGNKSQARESFAYKQLLFEPFMGGGIITATSLIIISEIGSEFALAGAVIITLFWLILGLYMGKKRRSTHERH